MFDNSEVKMIRLGITTGLFMLAVACFGLNEPSLCAPVAVKSYYACMTSQAPADMKIVKVGNKYTFTIEAVGYDGEYHKAAGTGTRQGNQLVFLNKLMPGNLSTIRLMFDDRHNEIWVTGGQAYCSAGASIEGVYRNLKAIKK